MRGIGDKASLSVQCPTITFDQFVDSYDQRSYLARYTRRSQRSLRVVTAVTDVARQKVKTPKGSVDQIGV